MIKNVYWTSCTVPHYSLLILMELEFYGYIFEKYSNIKFHDTPSSGSQVVPCIQTDRQTDRQMDGQRDSHDVANSHFLQFCKRA